VVPNAPTSPKAMRLALARAFSEFLLVVMESPLVEMKWDVLANN
jgi:hypothetical protein